MSRSANEHEELSAALGHVFRRMSGTTILFHQAVADRLGLNITDHKCLDLIIREGVETPGQLASKSGLTTGAITAVIDRLEKAGFVTRENDPADRRRVILKADMERTQKDIAPIFGSMAHAMADLCRAYSAHDLRLVLDFCSRTTDMAQKQIEQFDRD